MQSVVATKFANNLVQMSNVSNLFSDDSFSIDINSVDTSNQEREGDVLMNMTQIQASEPTDDQVDLKPQNSATHVSNFEVALPSTSNTPVQERSGGVVTLKMLGKILENVLANRQTLQKQTALLHRIDVTSGANYNSHASRRQVENYIQVTSIEGLNVLEDDLKTNDELSGQFIAYLNALFTGQKNHLLLSNIIKKFFNETFFIHVFHWGDKHGLRPFKETALVKRVVERKLC
jgi:hypothetical protein